MTMALETNLTSNPVCVCACVYLCLLERLPLLRDDLENCRASWCSEREGGGGEEEEGRMVKGWRAEGEMCCWGKAQDGEDRMERKNEDAGEVN